MERVKQFISWVQGTRPVRVFQHYGARRGALLASGLSYQALFAVFAAIWVGFSVAGLFIQSNPEIRDAFFAMINSSVPGLIDTGDGEGIVDPDDLEAGVVLSWTGAIALGGLLFTALGWLASARGAVRTIFDLPPEMLNVVLLRLKDAGLGLLFGAGLIISAALLVFSTHATEFVLGLIGIDADSTIATALGAILGVALMLAIDTVVLAGLYRYLSGLQIPLKRLMVGALMGAAGLEVLKILGSALLGGATRNPLLASFALIIGLLIWFNFLCQVILIAASWIAVGMQDVGLVADPKVAAAEAEERRKEAEKREADRIVAAQRLRRITPWWKRPFIRVR